MKSEQLSPLMVEGDWRTPTESTASQHEPFPLGAHIVTPRRWYTHHGIYVGAGQVIHYEGLSSALRRGPVAKVSLAEFAQGQPVRVHGEADMAYSRLEVVARACSRVGEDAYDVLRNNCEHFCSWCLMGVSRSAQVERVLSASRARALASLWLLARTHGFTSMRDTKPGNPPPR